VARKRRDYRAEYQARKQRATAAGYESVRQYGKVRKELNLPPRSSPVPKRIYLSGTQLKRQQAERWSRAHSHVKRSRYKASFTNTELEAYWQAFVRPPEPGETRLDRKFRTAKRKRVHDYLVGQGIITEQQWRDGNY
jgi:hypothetical protein